MKKLVFSALVGCGLLATQSLASEKSVYVGIDYLNNSNTIEYSDKTEEVDNNSKAFKFKIGFADNDNNLRTQLYFLSETYDEPIFDSSNDNLKEIGMDIIKTLPLTPKFLPFIQAGFGYGFMSIDGYNESSIAEVSFKVGVGAIYKITPKFELLGGLDFQYRKWQDREVTTTYKYTGVYYNYYSSTTETIETDETSSKLYVGLNLHF